MDSYKRTDQHLHLISQIIAKANRTFVPAKTDDSHTNLYFDSLGEQIYGRWINSSKGHVILALIPKKHQFIWLNQSLEEVQAIGYHGKTLKLVESEVEDSLTELGLDPQGFAAPLHYEISSYPFVNEVFETFKPKSLELWFKHRAIANTACNLLLGYFQANEEVRIWPHHFDTGVYFESTDQLGIGFGLAMSDDMVGQPYYYWSVYGLNGYTINYHQVPDLRDGHWILEDHWKGAVLPMQYASSIAPVASFIKEIIKGNY